MNRLFKILSLVCVAGGLAAAQTAPSNVIYNVANQHTYLITPQNLSWQTARTYARSLSGYLVAINGPAEQAFIAATYAGLQAPCWIGLSDAATEGVFLWDSGEPFNYTNWCPGQPDNWNGVEDYGEIFSTFTGLAPCWNEIQSPGTYGGPTRGIVELAHGVRVGFDDASTTCGSSPFPTPLGALGDPEGISWNGAGAGALRYPSATNIPEFGMPVRGLKYLRLLATGTLNLTAGGPFPRPAPANVNEIRIAIPAGTKGVSLAYDFLTAETAPYNDGMDFAVVDANGNVLTHLAYHDVLGSNYGVVPSTGAFCQVTGGVNLLPAGPKGLSRYLPALPHPAYLSIVAWNGEDDSFPSAVHLDAIQFWGTDELQLSLSAPFGPGSIRVENSDGVPNTPYWSVFTLAPGAYPNGWLFGLDITFPELMNQVSFGIPFAGTLDASGGSVFTLPSGVPPGLSVYGVSIQFGSEVTASAPRFFVTQ